MKHCAQPGILAPIPAHARYMFFSLAAEVSLDALRTVMLRLSELCDGEHLVIGVGAELVQALGAQVPDLRTMPDFSSHEVEVSSTPVALWCWLRGADRGALILESHKLEKVLVSSFHLDRVLDAFFHGDPHAEHGRDLTGYEDGTENPQGAAANAAALVPGIQAGLAASSYLVVQQWLHDMDAFEAMSTEQQDHTIGRRRSDNQELENAPAQAHVKRTAQDSFSPHAFVLRRSMPWATGQECGLFFTAFGCSFAAFEAQILRMTGQEDGVVDALFKFSHPISGAYLWCPPMRQGCLDLRQLGIHPESNV